MREIAKSRIAKFYTPILLLFASVFSFVLILPIGPSVLGDELIYSFQARFRSFDDLEFPNVLYFTTMQLTELCGPASYECSKLLNVLFAGGVAVLVFFLASIELPRYMSTALASLTLLGPLSIMQSFFMPEVFFALVATGAIAFAAHAMRNPSFSNILLVGVLTGLSAAAKPQGLIVHLTVFGGLFILFLVGRGRSRLSLLNLLTGLLVGMGVRYLGDAVYYLSVSPNVFGGSYDEGLGSGLRTIQSGASQSLSVAETISFQYWLLVLGMLVVFGPGLALIIPFVAKGFSDLVTGDYRSSGIHLPFAYLVLLTVLTLAVLVPVFATIVTFTGDDHTNRLLLRYLEFLILPSMMSAAVAAKTASRASLAIALTLVVVGLGISRIGLPAQLGTVDSAILRAVAAESMAISLLWAVIWGLVITWPLLSKSVPLASLTLVVLVLSGAGISVDAANRLGSLSPTLNPTNTGAQVVRDLAQGNNSAVLFLGFSKTEVQSAILAHDLVGAKFELASGGTNYGIEDLPEGIDWVVSTQEVFYSGPEVFYVAGDRFKVSLVGRSFDYYLSFGADNGLVTEVKGFSPKAVSGRWVNELESEIVFREGLPSNLTETILTLTCSIDCPDSFMAVSTGGEPISLGPSVQGNVSSYRLPIDATNFSSVVMTLSDDEYLGKVSVLSVSLR